MPSAERVAARGAQGDEPRWPTSSGSPTSARASRRARSPAGSSPGPGDRRGRPAGRDPDRQDDGRDPVARAGHGDADPRRRGRGRAGRHGARRHRRRGRPLARPQPRPRTRPSSGPRGGRPAHGPRPGDAARAPDRPELGVDLATRDGTGPGGRITEEDVAARRRRRAPAARGAARAAARRAPADRRAPDARPPRGAGRHLGRGVRLHRRRPARSSRLVLRASALSLQEFPELNARLDGDEIVYLDRYDLGVAVQTEQGLVVPVVRGCDRAARRAARRGRRLAERARAGTLEPDELRGSTFTVTSAGKLGGLFVTPLVNLSRGRDPRHPPHRAAAVVRDGEIVVRRTANIASRSTTASSTAHAPPPSAST